MELEADCTGPKGRCLFLVSDTERISKGEGVANRIGGIVYERFQAPRLQFQARAEGRSRVAPHRGPA